MSPPWVNLGAGESPQEPWGGFFPVEAPGSVDLGVFEGLGVPLDPLQCDALMVGLHPRVEAGQVVLVILAGTLHLTAMQRLLTDPFVAQQTP